MEGNVFTKLGRLAWYLARNPVELPRYLADRNPGRQSPIDREIPWFSYGAINFLDGYVQPHMSVFEWGSGGSTVFFSRRANSVLSVEDNAEWADRVTARLAERDVDNAVVKRADSQLDRPEKFANTEYVRAIQAGKFDIIVVDGTEPWPDLMLRPTCFHVAEEAINKNGIIIVDDSWRYPELRAKNKARDHRIFQGTGPARPGVTSTDIFFY